MKHFQAGLVAIALRAHTRSLSLKISGGRSPAREAREEKQSRDFLATVLRSSTFKSSNQPPPNPVVRSRSTPRRGLVSGGRLAVERDSTKGAKHPKVCVFLVFCHKMFRPGEKCF
jgi:hypothetical protein